MRHGYKGAFEIAATVDYLFAFAATSGCVADHHFDAVYEAYVENEEVQNFLKKENIDAFTDIIKRLLEAQKRELWKPNRNSIGDQLLKYLEIYNPSC
jgi:cobaltochelatase CobN